MSKPIAIQLVKRKPDTNGNVPRLLLIYSRTGDVVDIATIDYGNIPEQYRGVTRLPDMMLTPADYRAWLDLKKSRERG